jgi:hypothetical protein
MAKRGPKRKRNVVRFKCGQIDRVAPSAEVIARRIAYFAIAGVKPTDEKIDLRLGESWCGILFAAKVIDQRQYDALNKYHAVYKACLPQGFPGSSLDPDASTVYNEMAQSYEVFNCPESVVEAWAASEKVLGALGSRTHNLVKNICVYGRFARFIDVSSPRPLEAWSADLKDRTRFCCGAEALALAYGYGAAHLEERQAA